MQSVPIFNPLKASKSTTHLIWKNALIKIAVLWEILSNILQNLQKLLKVILKQHTSLSKHI